MTRGAPPEAGRDAPDGRQRLDKWLWFARVTKTRSLAARLVADGHVRVNGMRAEAPSHAIRPGTVLTIALERHVRVLKVVRPGDRRGPYREALTLYLDLTAPVADTPLRPIDS